MDKYVLIDKLPPYQDKWITVKQDHEVGDIIDDIIDKHGKFSGYYDKIALYFDRESIDEICKELNKFCIENIEYREEKGEDQTTAIPTGILLRGYGDCKHYASFIGGILDGINRATGKKIKWNYRFVSYDALNSTPHHVFIVVHDNGQEIWIDPTPGADKLNPFWVVDRYTKKLSGMPLQSNIGSVLALADMAGEAGAQDAANSLFSGLKNVFNDFFKSLTIGDQVPNYPIKSKNTYSKIVTQIQGEFPPPVNLQDAQEQLARAQESARVMNEKGGDVNITYAMIYTEVANALKQVIAQAQAQGTKGGTSSPFTPPISDSGSKSNLLLFGALGLGAFIMLNPKKKSVHGLSTTNLLLLAVGGFIVYKFVIVGASSKRKDLDGMFTKEGLPDIADKMTDQEISDTWELVFYYTPNEMQAPEPLATRLRAISAKYNIFT